jgi:hypothetical protein
MADYIPPTADDFFKRFPKFDDGSLDIEYQVEGLIAEAMTQVDDSWLQKDYAPAIMYLVAHMMTAEGGDIVDRAGAIQSESFGPMSRSYAAGTATADQLSSTEYGRRYVALRSKNFPGVAVV